MSYSPDDPNILTVVKGKKDKTKPQLFPFEECQINQTPITGWLGLGYKDPTRVDIDDSIGIRDSSDPSSDNPLRSLGNLGSRSNFVSSIGAANFREYPPVNFRLSPYSDSVRIVYNGGRNELGFTEGQQCVDGKNEVQQKATEFKLKTGFLHIDTIVNFINDAIGAVGDYLFGSIKPAKDLTKLNTCQDTHNFSGVLNTDEISQKFKIIPIDNEKFQIQLPNDGGYPLCLSRERDEQYYTTGLKSMRIGADIVTTNCNQNDSKQQWKLYPNEAGNIPVNPNKMVEKINTEPLMGFRNSGNNIYCTYNLDKFTTLDDLNKFRTNISDDRETVNRVATKVCPNISTSLKNEACFIAYTDTKPLPEKALRNIEPQCLLVPATTPLAPAPAPAPSASTNPSISSTPVWYTFDGGDIYDGQPIETIQPQFNSSTSVDYSVEGCAKRCLNNSNCLGFTYNPSIRKCNLVGGVDNLNKVTRVGRIEGNKAYIHVNRAGSNFNANSPDLTNGRFIYNTSVLPPPPPPPPPPAPKEDITKRGLFNNHGACINYYTQKIKSKTLTEEEKQSLVDRCKQLEDPTSAEICRLVCKENEVCDHLTDYCRVNLEKCGDLTFAGKLHEKVLYTACAHADFVDPTPLPTPGQIKIIVYDKSDNSTEYTTFTKNEAEGIKFIIFDLGKNIEIKRMEFQTSVSLYDKVVNILDSLNPNLPSKKTFRIEKGFYDLYDSLLYSFPQTVLGRYIRIDIQRPHNKNIFQDTCGQFVNLTKVNGLIENRLNTAIVKECKHMREQNMGNPKDFPECSCFLPDAEREKLADAIKNKSRGEVKETRLGCIFEPCVMQEAYKNQSTNCPPITVCTNDVSITNYGSIEGDLTVRGTNDCGSADGTNISLQNVDCVASAWSDCRYVLDTSGKPIDGFQTRNVILPKEGEGTNCGPLERKCPEFAPKDDDVSKSNTDASAGLMTAKNGVLFGIVVVLVVGGYFVWASMKPKTENKN